MAGLLLGGTLGTLFIVVLAWMDGRPLGPAIGVGGSLAFVFFGCLRPPWTDMATQVDPRSDDDGLVRTVLQISAEHECASALTREARQRSWRFLPLTELTAWWVIVLLAVVLAAWNQGQDWSTSNRSSTPNAAQQGATGTEGTGPAARSDPGAADSAAASSDPRSERPMDTTRPDQKKNQPNSETPRPISNSPVWKPVRWASISPPDAAPTTVRGGRDFGEFQAAVNEYLRLRAEKDR